jgi:hypothetical protein
VRLTLPLAILLIGTGLGIRGRRPWARWVGLAAGLVIAFVHAAAFVLNALGGEWLLALRDLVFAGALVLVVVVLIRRSKDFESAQTT